MMNLPFFRKELTCSICHQIGTVSEIDTYKSTWLFCENCECYSRHQKDRYPYEALVTTLLPLFRYVPKLNGFLSSLGRKKQGVDFYRYYSAQLASGERGPWLGESDMVISELRGAKLLQDWADKRILDISGEPGFFAQDLMLAGADVLVTAFASDVAQAMTDHLGVKSLKFDFNTDNIIHKVKAVEGRTFNYIFVRYSIGFCLDVPRLMQNLSSLLATGGLLYVSFSPASRAVLLRWMFDDYTYLRQYTEAYLNEAAVLASMSQCARFDEGSFYWDHGPYSLHWSLRPFARRYFKVGTFFKSGGEQGGIQHRVALVYRKD